MSHRQFTDSGGVEWLAFDVTPRADDRRNASRRWSDDAAGPQDPGAEERRGPDRRLTVDGQRPPRLTKGWLCFEREGERRRLQPVPERWTSLPDDELQKLLDAAIVARVRNSGSDSTPTRRR